MRDAPEVDLRRLFFRELTSSSFAASSSTSVVTSKNLFVNVSPFHEFYFLKVFLPRRKSDSAPHQKSIFSHFFFVKSHVETYLLTFGSLILYICAIKEPLFHRVAISRVLLTGSFLPRRKSVCAPHRKSIFAHFFSSNHMC